MGVRAGGSKRSTRGWLIGLAAVALLALAPGASASAREKPAHIEFSGQGRTGDGYRLGLRLEREGSRASATLQIFDAGRRAYTASNYSPTLRRRIQVQRKRIRTPFADRGSLDMRFATTRTRPKPDLCGATVKEGVLKGRLRFRGPGRFTSFNLRRLAAVKRVGGRPGCFVIEFRQRRALRRAAADGEYALGACRPDASVFAFRDPPPDRFVAVFADLGEQRTDGLRVSHDAGVFFRGAGPTAASAFAVDGEQDRATLEPGRPFRGVGSYADRALRGDLRFSAPGRKGIALTPSNAKLRAGSGVGVHCGIPEEPAPTSRLRRLQRRAPG